MLLFLLLLLLIYVSPKHVLQWWQKVTFCALLSTCPDLSFNFLLFFSEMFAGFAFYALRWKGNLNIDFHHLYNSVNLLHIASRLHCCFYRDLSVLGQFFISEDLDVASLVLNLRGSIKSWEDYMDTIYLKYSLPIIFITSRFIFFICILYIEQI